MLYRRKIRVVLQGHGSRRDDMRTVNVLVEVASSSKRCCSQRVSLVDASDVSRARSGIDREFRVTNACQARIRSDANLLTYREPQVN